MRKRVPGQPALLFILLWLAVMHVWADLSAEQRAAKEEGIALFNQYRTAEPLLRIAAEAGDAESQFYLGEELRLRDRFMTKEVVHWLEEVEKWYNASAEGGYPLSMENYAQIESPCTTNTRRCLPHPFWRLPQKLAILPRSFILAKLCAGATVL